MLLDSGEPGFEALIAPGHVSTVMGPEEWEFVPRDHRIPTAVAGFAPDSLLAALYSVLRQKLEGKAPMREILRISREAIGDPHLLPAMILSGALFATGIIGIWGYFLRLTQAGVSVGAYGVYFAVFQAASAAAAARTSRRNGSSGPLPAT